MKKIFELGKVEIKKKIFELKNKFEFKDNFQIEKKNSKLKKHSEFRKVETKEKIFEFEKSNIEQIFRKLQFLTIIFKIPATCIKFMVK